MTAQTRRRLTFLLVLGLITLPAEAMLWPVVRTPDARLAAMDWAKGRSVDELQAAALKIDQYPAIYRRAIMASLTPADRSKAWRAHFQNFIATHPQLTAHQVAALQQAIDVASAEAFTPPVSTELQQRIGRAFEEAKSALDAKTAGELFVTLGPKQEKVNALPLMERVANRLRNWRVVIADYPDCNCNIEIDTCDIGPDPWLQCSELYTCEFDLDWPMCGPLWAWACTGWCKVLRWPAGMEE